MRVTIDELASRLGLSSASVSYALNGQPGVSDATRARVKALAKELDWHPSSSARALSRSRSDAIGIILRRDPGLLRAEPYFMSMFAGVEEVLSEVDQTLLFRMVGSAATDDLAIYRRWHSERRVDGVMLFDHTEGDERPALLSELGLPYVAHGSNMTAIGVGTFVYDLDGDASLIADHLHALGHRRLVHVHGSHLFTNEQNRSLSLRRAAESLGMHYTATEGDYGMEQAARVAARALDGPNAPTAFVTSNDVMALGITVFLRQAGRKDVAVVSFDDSMLCQTSAPSITALDRFTEEQGRRSTRYLLAMLDGATEVDAQAAPSALRIRETSVRVDS